MDHVIVFAFFQKVFDPKDVIGKGLKTLLMAPHFVFIDSARSSSSNSDLKLVNHGGWLVGVGG